MRKSLFLVFLGLGLVLSGCAPAFFKYRYISLDAVDGIEIIEQGRSEIDNLFFHSDMPVTYALTRKAYRLRFEVDKRTYGAEMTVTLLSDVIENPLLQAGAPDDRSAGVTFDYASPAAQARSGSAAFDDTKARSGQALKFRPSYGSRSSGRETYRLVLDVADGSGQRIARESLEFQLETNGFYYVIDAI